MSDPARVVAKQYQALKFPGLLVQRTVYVVGPTGGIIFAAAGMPADETIMEAIRRDRT